MRHPEPEAMRQYRELVKNRPRCCHTCEYYNDDGLCTLFAMVPPEDFAGSPDACENWQDDIPF